MKDLEQIIEAADKGTQPIFNRLKLIESLNHQKVIDAFKAARVSSHHLKGSTGYGYDDDGREALEKVYAQVFKTEDAIVRGQIVSGTHAIALCLYGILRPGDLLLTIQGKPYDTLDEIIGLQGDGAGSLQDLGVNYRQIELLPDGKINWDSIEIELKKPVKMVLIQRSCGYSIRTALDMSNLKELCTFIKSKQADTIILVDNCYGEFVEEAEPPENGADLIAGSLIKNPGGGIAPTGGYVAGKRELVELAARRLTAPGIGSDVGPTLGWQRMFFEGFYLAPHLVMQALRSAIWGAMFYKEMGFKVFPEPEIPRTDIIQAIFLNSRERLEAFCRGVQASSPVDSHVVPVPAPIPGYTHPVIMAAGTFVQGASMEFTADAPVTEPYVVYYQGGLSLDYSKIGLIQAAREVMRW